ncbi:hypothetical protein CYJ37_03505 [Bacillus sp. UMB0728]|jgi:hypothetical protein|nr:hypothetical protein CYJ37_03505 [Bacillus sp. UMB0728]
MNRKIFASGRFGNWTNLCRHMIKDQSGKVSEMRADSRFIFFVIEASSIRKFLALEMGFGTAFYYGAKVIFANEIASVCTSIVAVEALKKGLKQLERK